MKLEAFLLLTALSAPIFAWSAQAPSAANKALALSATNKLGTEATPSALSPTELKRLMHQALKEKKPIVDFWLAVHARYGSETIAPLMGILDNEREADELRWASLFGIARLTGKNSRTVLKRFSNHRSWLLRDASLRAIAAINASELAPIVSDALGDKALVVRTTAVDVIGHMKLKELAPKLVGALSDPLNYRREKPLWIHSHILKVLVDLKYTEATPQLVELLEQQKDPDLRAQVVGALERLTGKSFAGRHINEQVYLWKRNTMSEKTF